MCISLLYIKKIPTLYYKYILIQLQKSIFYLKKKNYSG